MNKTLLPQKSLGIYRTNSSEFLISQRTFETSLFIRCGEKRFSQRHISFLPTPPLGQDMTQGQLLSGV